MPLLIVRNDITKMAVDAIVNAANSSLLGGGGVDGAIHRAAGPELLDECRTLGGCPTGQAKLTKGYKLPAKYVIHTVGPIWSGGNEGEEGLLRSCYRSSLELAAAQNCESVAFPLISAGAYGYPKAEALQAATNAIWDFLREHDMMVYLCVFDKESFEVSCSLLGAVASYIDDHYAGAHAYNRSELLETEREAPKIPRGASAPMPAPPSAAVPSPSAPRRAAPRAAAVKSSIEDDAIDGLCRLDDLIGHLDEPFADTLFRLIDAKGMTDPEVYKKANLDRKLFSKIRTGKGYTPKKPTILALAIALELSLKETRSLLERAGYALSHASKFDVIVEYFIVNQNYNIFEINEVLFKYDLPLLGG